MLKLISFKLAVNAMLILLALVIVFHLLILIQVIPYNIVWAGRLQNVSEMVVFELVSLLINTMLIAVITIKAGYVKSRISPTVINVLLWFMVIVFSLNTIGNLFSKTSFETLVFTPLTFISALLCYRIVREPNTKVS
jgi:hypothetical protein